MSVYETVGRNQKTALSMLHHRNEAVLGVMKPFFKATAELPRIDRLPTPKETVEQWFGFLDGVLKEQKTFMLDVVKLLPERTTKPAVVKPEAKAA